MNRKVTIGLIILIAVLIAGFGFFEMNKKDAVAPTTEASNTQTTPVSPQTNNTESEDKALTITFTSDGFNPSSATIKKGGTVTVKNESSMNVQFSSDDHPTHRLETEMNLKVLQPGESASFVISRVGSWGFHDHIDDSKTGILTVTE